MTKLDIGDIVRVEVSLASKEALKKGDIGVVLEVSILSYAPSIVDANVFSVDRAEFMSQHRFSKIEKMIKPYKRRKE